MRYMGLDIGERRIGIAYANFLNVGSSVVVPGGFLEVRSGPAALGDLKDMVLEEGVDAVVVGLPLREGFESRQCQKIRAFAELLRPLLPPEVALHFWDEALTSVAAGDLLVQAELKHSGRKKRGRVDGIAATLMLQGFVDSRRMHVPPVGPVL
jgi:putative Holliday junction resolvase